MRNSAFFIAMIWGLTASFAFATEPSSEKTPARKTAKAAFAQATPKEDKAVSTNAAASEPIADYFPAVKQELARLALSPVCVDAETSCTADGRLVSRKETVKLTIQYSRDSDTVYIFIDKFVEYPKGDKPSAETALKLLALNSELLTSKLEWDGAANAVRLSTVLSTDSNFDRRAFRSQLLGLLKVADKIRGEFQPK